MTSGSVLDAAVATQRICEQSGLRGCVIGGVALQRWGEPRYTADVDFSVLVEAGSEIRVAEALLARLEPRIADAADFATRSRVILARSPSGVGIDIVLAGLPYEARVIERASPWDIGSGISLATCSAEDLLRQRNLGL